MKGSHENCGVKFHSLFDWTVICHFSDNGIFGMNLNRPKTVIVTAFDFSNFWTPQKKLLNYLRV